MLDRNIMTIFFHIIKNINQKSDFMIKSKGIFKARDQNSKDNWMTPKYFFNLLDSEFHFELDPCSDDQNHLCDNYYTEEENGLDQYWEGLRVFVNPPFSQKENWIRKCYEESLKKNTEIVLIIPSTTDTKIWHEIIMKFADEIRFCLGRVNFKYPEVLVKNSPTFPLSIIIFRNIRKYHHLYVTSFFHKNLQE